ncbi:SgcJ/EcaC family oxidoreductase [Spirosoma sp. KNUC1025]|uniref:SgcJ/EcaC family oxidoreductase n=1 Tax=Spirosoma sp. KNUC1025 TaxID=2894082 RepID=UPI00386753F5|nr:SgcJ/EcaC family oxidoreductase [Spirosoma sp. KNUC1025]
MNQLFIITVTSLVMLFATPTQAQQSADSLTIQTILQEEVTSWNRGDAVTYSKHFAENGTFTNIRGMFFTGHQPFLDRHVEIFKGMFAKTVMHQNIVSFRFLSPEAAIVETLTWITGFPKGGSPKAIHIDDKGRLHTRLLQVFQKQKGDWKIVVYHNVDLKPDTPVPAHN